MSELKCPFCNQKLEPIGTSGQFQCGTWGCDASFNFIATRDVWEYIGRTRKALDVAVDELKRIDETRSGVKENLHATNGRTLNEGNGFCWATIDEIHNALEQITALEQKDK